MTVIARDAVAADHLVYAWPFPIGPEEYEVSCADDELVVMCPSWMVGDRLGPGRHRWRTPDPMRPVSAYFVLTAPVEVSFDMITQFMIPTTGQAVRLRASGSLQVRCMDPALLVAQFVGLPFDQVNDGVLRSVSRSIERMLARLLTRRVVMAGTPQAVTDPAMLANIIEELVAYNPTAGAVFGIELVRFGHLTISADDGSQPWQALAHAGPNGQPRHQDPTRQYPIVQAPAGTDLLETQRGRPGPRREKTAQLPTILPAATPPPHSQSSPLPPPIPAAAKRTPSPPGPPSEAAGEIVIKSTEQTTAPEHTPAAPTATQAVPPPPASAGTPAPPSISSPPARVSSPSIEASVPPARHAVPIDVPQMTDELTQPGVDIVGTPPPGSLPVPNTPAPASTPPAPATVATGTKPPTEPAAEPARAKPRGTILGIGVTHIGATDVVSGEITSGENPQRIAPGGRVLVPGPNGLMQSATVRQLLQGYYELEVGGTGETIWVPVNGVVPE